MNELSENFNKLDKQQMTEGGAQLSEEKQIKSIKKHPLLRKKGNKENSSHVTVSLKCASSSQHASTIGTAKENDGNSATVPDLEHASSLHAKPGHTQLKKMAVDNLHRQKPRQISNALFLSVTKKIV